MLPIAVQLLQRGVVVTFDLPHSHGHLGIAERHECLAGSDLIFTFYTDDETRREIEAQPLYASIPAIERGSVVASDDNSFVTASSIINPLTVPWVIDRYLPLIDEAVAALDS